LRDISLLAKNYCLIHGGSVSWKNKGLIFQGISGNGKTTLTIKLTKKGFKFLSDEVVCLNFDKDLIAPFFRKLNLNDESRCLLGLPAWENIGTRLIKRGEMEWALDIEDIIPASLSDPVPPSYLLFLKGFAEKPRLEDISSSNAIFELLKFSISPINDPASMIFRLSPLLNKMKCYNLIIGELKETTDLILELIDEGECENA
jgi:hypothetical protein